MRALDESNSVFASNVGRLRSQGIAEADALELLGAALLIEMERASAVGEPFTRASYVASLGHLPDLDAGERAWLNAAGMI